MSNESLKEWQESHQTTNPRLAKKHGIKLVGHEAKESKVEEKKEHMAKKMKRGNYSIFKIEGDKHTRLKHNMSHAEMSEQLKSNPEYKGGEGYGFGGRRTYLKKK